MLQTLMGIVLVTQFLVPGAVFRSFRSRYLVVPTPGNQHDNLLSLLITGLWNFVITYPLLSAFGVDPLTPALAAADPAALGQAIRAHSIAWIFQLLIAPVVLATFATYISRKRWTETLLRKMGLYRQTRAFSAWDAAFHHVRETDVLVAITYKNPRKGVLYGRLGANSAASQASVNHDLFVDAVYTLDPASGNLVLDEETLGHYVPGSEIGGLTFMEMPAEAEEIDDTVVVPALVDDKPTDGSGVEEES